MYSLNFLSLLVHNVGDRVERREEGRCYGKTEDT
jgi:hypothetical protein